MEHFAAV